MISSDNWGQARARLIQKCYVMTFRAYVTSAYLRAVSSSLFRAIPFCSYQQGSIPLSHCHWTTLYIHQHGSWYTGALLTTRQQQSSWHILCLYDQINEACARYRNAFLPSWFAITQTTVPLLFRRKTDKLSFCCVLQSIQLHLHSLCPAPGRHTSNAQLALYAILQ